MRLDRLGSASIAATEHTKPYPDRDHGNRDSELHGRWNRQTPVRSLGWQRDQDNRHDEERIASTKRPRLIPHTLNIGLPVPRHQFPGEYGDAIDVPKIDGHRRAVGIDIHLAASTIAGAERTGVATW